MADNDGTYINAAKALAGMDLTILAGLTFGFAMICTAIYLGCSIESFINPSSILIMMSAAFIGNRQNLRRFEMPLNNWVHYVE